METHEENKVFYSAQVEALVLAANVAIKTGDSDAVLDIANQLTEIAGDLEVSADLRDLARSIREEIGFGLTDAGLAAMNQKVAQLSGASAQLQKAIDTAKTGQKESFFLKIAEKAQQALTALNDFKTSLANIQKNLRDASQAELGNLPKRLKTLLESVQDLRNSKAA